MNEAEHGKGTSKLRCCVTKGPRDKIEETYNKVVNKTGENANARDPFLRNTSASSHSSYSFDIQEEERRKQSDSCRHVES